MENKSPQNGTFYQRYDRSLNKITGDETFDNILDFIDSNPNQNNSSMVSVPSSTIGSGPSTTANTSSGSMQSGKQSFEDTTAGYFIGIDSSDGIAKWNFGNGTSFITWNGTNLVVTGSISVSSLNIPDTVTTASFHVDTSGNTWWGANVVSGLAAAPAYVTAAGAALFQNVVVGGNAVTYQITNSGMFSYGDGSDGAAVCDGATSVAGMSGTGPYTMTRDVYFTTLTVNSGVTVKTNGYRIFCSISLSMSGTLDNSGGNGTAGQIGQASSTAKAAGGSGGSGAPSGYLIGGTTGGNGGNGSQGNTNNPVAGGAGTVVSNCIGSGGVLGGAGGNGVNGGNTGGAAGTAGTATASNVKLIANWHLATLLDIGATGATVKFTPCGGGGGGGGGASANAFNTTSGGGGGGGAGGSGGIIAVYARVITIGSSGVMMCMGGNGAIGGAGISTDTANGSGGGGGGAGGNGGIVVLVYNSLSNTGSITCAAGTGSVGGTGGVGSVRNGVTGGTGANGSAGSIYQFMLSL